MTKDQILAALPAFSKADLKAIQAAVAVLMARGHHDSPQPLKSPQGWLYEALQGVAGWPPVGFDRFMTSTAGQHFKQNAPLAIDFMLRAFGPKATGNKITALAIMRSMIELLVADLRGRDAPLSPGVIASNLGRLDQVFEAAYPDYIHNGIGSMILRAMLRKRK